MNLHIFDICRHNKSNKANTMSKFTKEDSIERLNKINFSMIDDSLYVNTNTRMLIKCRIHDITWESTVGEAYRKAKYCEECRKFDGDWVESARKNNYIIVGENGENATFQCEFEHETWTTKKENIKFTKCKECSGKKLSKQTVLDKIKSLGFEFLSQDNFNSTREVGKFKCAKDHTWSCYIHNVYSEKSGCPECSTTNGERRCRFILETIFKKAFIRTRDIVKINDQRLELDMYNEELMMACEYNGIQHYFEDNKFFHKNGGFEEQVERDSLKKQYCDENGIKLIIVPYTVYKFTDTVDYILSELKIQRDEIDIDWDIKQIEYTSLVDNNLLTTTKMRSEMDDIADKKNAKYLGATSNGRRNLHKFLCDNGHEFILQASDVNRGRWCWDCSGRKPLSTSTVMDILAKINMSLIGEYVNSGTNIIIKCNYCKNEFEKNWDNVKQRELKYGCCYLCNSSNIKITEINEKLEKIGFKFADKLYIDAKTKNTYECEKGHKITANWNAIKVRAGKCKECNPSKNMLKQAKKKDTSSKD